MKDFDLIELFAIKPKKPKSPTDIDDLIEFFEKRQITVYKLAQVLDISSAGVYDWFNGRFKVPKHHKKNLYAIQQIFIDWENEHGMVFNSEEHLLKQKADIDKPKTKPPTPKIVLPKFTTVPLHDCPYTKEGLNFGLDYNEYDVCDDCFLSTACLRYKKRYESWRKAK
jgi:hypothetical protein